MTTPVTIVDTSAVPAQTPGGLPATPPVTETPTLESVQAENLVLTERLKNTREYGDTQKNRGDGLEKVLQDLKGQPGGPLPTSDDAALATENARLKIIELVHIKSTLKATYNLSDEEVSGLEGTTQFELNSSAMTLTLQKIANGTLTAPGATPAAPAPTGSTPPVVPPKVGVDSIPGQSATAANTFAKSDSEAATAMMDKAAGRTQ